jgi:DNA-binding NtrC family response regulator
MKVEMHSPAESYKPLDEKVSYLNEKTVQGPHTTTLTPEIESLLNRLVARYIICSIKAETIPLRSFLGSIEKTIIDVMLMVTKGSRRKAADILGVKMTTLCEKVKKQGINTKEFYEDTPHFGIFAEIMSFFINHKIE